MMTSTRFHVMEKPLCSTNTRIYEELGMIMNFYLYHGFLIPSHIDRVAFYFLPVSAAVSDEATVGAHIPCSLSYT
jgi:hypothetical protein